MTDPHQLRPGGRPPVGSEFIQARIPSLEYSRFLYASVGGSWNWTDRLEWDDRRLAEYLEHPDVETWVGYVEGTPAGYAELDGRIPGETEIAYFGLMPRFIGQRLGGHLLTLAVERAWALASRTAPSGEPDRVWLHTCSDDSGHALPNYRARGFTVYKTEESVEADSSE